MEFWKELEFPKKKYCYTSGDNKIAPLKNSLESNERLLSDFVIDDDL